MKIARIVLFALAAAFLAGCPKEHSHITVCDYRVVGDSLQILVETDWYYRVKQTWEYGGDTPDYLRRYSVVSVPLGVLRAGSFVPRLVEQGYIPLVAGEEPLLARGFTENHIALPIGYAAFESIALPVAGKWRAQATKCAGRSVVFRRGNDEFVVLVGADGIAKATTLDGQSPVDIPAGLRDLVSRRKVYGGEATASPDFSLVAFSELGRKDGIRFFQLDSDGIYRDSVRFSTSDVPTSPRNGVTGIYRADGSLLVVQNVVHRLDPVRGTKASSVQLVGSDGKILGEKPSNGYAVYDPNTHTVVSMFTSATAGIVATDQIPVKLWDTKSGATIEFTFPGTQLLDVLESGMEVPSDELEALRREFLRRQQ